MTQDERTAKVQELAALYAMIISDTGVIAYWTRQIMPGSLDVGGDALFEFKKKAAKRAAVLVSELFL